MELGLIRRVVVLAGSALGIAALASCSEQLEGGKSCPVLCPQENLDVREAILTPVAFDTTLAGYPLLGDDVSLLLASRGDTVDTRVVVRFDSLPEKYTHPAGGDSTIARVDSARVLARLVLPALNPSSPVTIQVFDVDTTATDTLPETLLPLFRDDRKIGEQTVTLSAITDTTLRIAVSDSAVLDKITGKKRLRLGFRVGGAQSAQLRILSSGTASPPRLAFRVSTDTATACCVKSPLVPLSVTPAGDDVTRLNLRDYTVVARQPLATVPDSSLAVGGLSGRRSFLRFELPPEIVDSTSIVRATLLLTQRTAPRLTARDSVMLQVTVPVAREVVADIERQLLLITELHLVEGLPNPTKRDTVTLSPAREGVHEIELGPLLRSWRAANTPASRRAIVLRAFGEREAPGEILFYSSEAAPALRPRLRVTYVPRGGYGVP